MNMDSFRQITWSKIGSEVQLFFSPSMHLVNISYMESMKMSVCNLFQGIFRLFLVCPQIDKMKHIVLIFFVKYISVFAA